MINLTSSSAVSWPTPASTAVAPVSPVPSVPALSGAGAESQAGARSWQGGRGHAFPSSGQRRPDEAPLASREKSASAAPVVRDLETQAAQQKAERQIQAARERQKEAMEHLKEVLTNVWQASAAVVDRALGRETSTPGTQSDTAPDLSQVAASLVARRRTAPAGAPELPTETPAMPWGSASASSQAFAVPQDNPPADVVSYDLRGNSSLAPLDPGSHFSQRV